MHKVVIEVRRCSLLYNIFICFSFLCVDCLKRRLPHQARVPQEGEFNLIECQVSITVPPYSCFFCYADLESSMVCTFQE